MAETEGPGQGLLLLDGIADELDQYHPFHAARGWMLGRLGLRSEAAQAYARAALATTESVVRFLREQAEIVQRGR